jgi:type IV pilus assembly protein PilM
MKERICYLYRSVLRSYMFCEILDRFKSPAYPIGVDVDGDTIKMAQLGRSQKGPCIVAGSSQKVPPELVPGSSEWQRWAANSVKKLSSNGIFRGREAITALPADDVYIEQISVPRMSDNRLKEAVLSKVQQKLPFDSTDALVRYVVTSEQVGGITNNTTLQVLVMVAERIKVERHLAMCEKGGLQVKAVSVWPFAMTNSYAKFFNRRAGDEQVVVMLLETGANSTKVVICRDRELLFARLIPLGAKKLTGEEMIKRLILELLACERFFESISGTGRIGRLIYLSSQVTEKAIRDQLAQLAQRWHIPAQVGDVLGAVQVVKSRYGCGFDRRGCQVNWATVFGLSLS